MDAGRRVAGRPAAEREPIKDVCGRPDLTSAQKLIVCWLVATGGAARSHVRGLAAAVGQDARTVRAGLLALERLAIIDRQSFPDGWISIRLRGAGEWEQPRARHTSPDQMAFAFAEAANDQRGDVENLAWPMVHCTIQRAANATNRHEHPPVVVRAEGRDVPAIARTHAPQRSLEEKHLSLSNVNKETKNKVQRALPKGAPSQPDATGPIAIGGLVGDLLDGPAAETRHQATLDHWRRAIRAEVPGCREWLVERAAEHVAGGLLPAGELAGVLSRVARAIRQGRIRSTPAAAFNDLLRRAFQGRGIPWQAIQ